ncbi:MAG: hypothetical protein H6625_12980 [Bdellovibrionaceae bacterium]|nr:hypothetical protein [Pseudobdellovibrionaceae bacterium]
MGAKLLIIGLLAIVPISIIIWLEQYILVETIIRDSNPLKFILLVLGLLGFGFLGASIGYYSTVLIQKTFRNSKFSHNLTKVVTILFFLISIVGVIAWWGSGMH